MYIVVSVYLLLPALLPTQPSYTLYTCLFSEVYIRVNTGSAKSPVSVISRFAGLYSPHLKDLKATSAASSFPVASTRLHGRCEFCRAVGQACWEG